MELLDDSIDIFSDENMNIQNIDGLKYLNTLDNNSIDLIITDPPYIISRDTGMNNHYEKIKENEEKGIKKVKTEKQWEKYKKKIIYKMIIIKKIILNMVRYMVKNMHIKQIMVIGIKILMLIF